MKIKLLLLPLFLLFLSCEEQGELTNSRQDAISPGAALRYTGIFAPTSGITVNGGVRIYQEGNGYKLQLDNFSISDGPDLKVYLSKSATPDTFVNLGNLTTATVYSIPPQVDFSQYKYVLIHCQQYNHLFAVAFLTEN